VLTRAVVAGRLAVAEMEPDDVPAPLRRVRAHTGGSLPPPFMLSILTALDEDEELRAAAHKQLESRYHGTAAASFLTRDTGWWEVVAMEAVDVGATLREREADKATKDAQKAVARLAEAQRRLKATQVELEAERSQRRISPVSARSPVVDAEVLRDMTQTIALLETRLAVEERDRIEAVSMIARLRARLKRAAKQQRAESAGGAEDLNFSLGGDAVAIARNLDLLAAAAKPPGNFSGQKARRAPDTVLAIPKGVRPDKAEAIIWLGSLDQPLTVLVDGYNVLFGMDAGTFTTGTARKRLVQDLARLRRRGGAVRMVAVFDSSLPGDRDVHAAPGGVEVRFAAEEELADDEIVELVVSGRGPVIVITSDRDLQARAEAEGAVILFSEALTEWVGK
jgi:predicted RNA-binding protein with PIN domain